jgi:hypothetical protein
MQIKIQKFEVWFKRLLPAVALGSLIFLSGAPRAKANDWDDCNRRIAKYQWRLREAVEDHGYGSRQARHWRHELREEYEKQDKLRRKHRDRWGRNDGWSDGNYDRYEDRSYYRDRERWNRDGYQDGYDRRERDDY